MLHLANAGQKHGVDLLTYQKAVANELKTVVCSGDESAAYIVHKLIRADRIIRDAPKLAESILASECPVSAVLTDADRMRLKKIAETASPPVPEHGL